MLFYTKKDQREIVLPKATQNEMEIRNPVFRLIEGHGARGAGKASKMQLETFFLGLALHAGFAC